MHDGCGCALGAKGGSCSRQFSETDVLFNLNNCLELSNDELDLVILASIHSPRVHWNQTKQKPSMQLLLSVSTDLQRNVPTLLRTE